MAILCRSCDREMERVKRGAAQFWRCGGCGAHLLAETTLRKIVPPQVWTAIWPALRAAATPGPRACPSCGRSMEETGELPEAASLCLDRCDACGLVWFDPKELEPLPKVPVEPPPPRLSRNAAKLLAEAIAAEYDEREGRLFGPFLELFRSLVVGFLVGFRRR